MKTDRTKKIRWVQRIVTVKQGRRRQPVVHAYREDKAPRAMRRARRGFLTKRLFTIFLFAFCTRTCVLFTKRGLIRERGSTSPSRVLNRVAVVCYGLPRSLHYTFKSLRRQIILPLLQHGVSVDVYAHSYVHERPISNSRSSEHNVTLDNEEWRLLDPAAHSVELAQVVRNSQSQLVRQLMKFGDSWKDSYSSLERYMLALHSAERAIAQIKHSRMKYDGVVLTRGDLLFLDPIDPELFARAVRSMNVVVPAWQSWRGLNDRFMFGYTDSIVLFANRGKSALEFCMTTGESFHSEKFLLWFSEHKHRSVRSPVRNPFCTLQRAARVRANGRIERENFTADYPCST